MRAILAFSAVGSLREDIAPGDFVLPTQIIDRTKGIRPTSFFDGTSIVAHVGFGDPFSNKFVKWLEKPVKEVLEKHGNGAKLHTEKCVVCMEGPQFSTRAESKMYRAWGADIINMSVLPEAKLAREAELGCVNQHHHDVVGTLTNDEYTGMHSSQLPLTTTRGGRTSQR